MRYLGVDYGLRKIGLAISEGQIASIFKVLEIKGLKNALSQINNIIKEENIDRVVVGVPESGELAKAVKKFISYLKQNNVVIETDETLSSQDARKLMLDLNLNKKEREKKEDAYSAALILQNFLDSLN